MTLREAIDDPTSNDEYVAQLLASEAKDKSIKYSALGLQAYLPRRPTDRAPKPNTRFLKNILRDTDSHNAALRRKEEQEARERMRKLRGDRSPPSNRSDRRERHRENERSYRNRSPHRREKDRTSKRKQLEGCSDKTRTRRHHRHYEDDESESEHDREQSSKSPHRYRSEKRRSAMARDSSESGNKSSRRLRNEKGDTSSRSRSRSPEVSRHRRDDYKHYERRKPVADHSQTESNQPPELPIDAYTSDDASDPLEDIVGPLPASLHKSERVSGVPTRGRGTHRLNSSTIDSHFAHDYDPKLDVDISENEEGAPSKRSTRRPVAGLMTDDDDWDMALEALRDRAHWRQKGEERLRAAGFDDNSVRRWKQDPAFTARRGDDTEGRIENVIWAKKGEGREWDRGKVRNDDGQYDVKAQW